MPIDAIVEPSPKNENKRETTRWRIRLQVPGSLGGESTNVVIHDISNAGMLMETKSKLKIGQSIMVSLPEADNVPARVVWQDEPLFGCRFDQPLQQSVVSAARLRNPSRNHVAPADDPAEEKAPERLPQRLRRLRQEQGLTRAVLAERTGFSKPTIWGWETGRTTPRNENLLILASVLGVTEQQLLFGAENCVSQGKGRANPEESGKSLTEIVDLSKARIAKAAGVTKGKVHIHIEL